MNGMFLCQFIRLQILYVSFFRFRFGMTVEDVRDYEKKMQEETNIKVLAALAVGAEGASSSGDTVEEDGNKQDPDKSPQGSSATSPTTQAGEDVNNATNPVSAAAAGLRSWLSWS